MQRAKQTLLSHTLCPWLNLFLQSSLTLMLSFVHLRNSNALRTGRNISFEEGLFNPSLTEN